MVLCCMAREFVLDWPTRPGRIRWYGEPVLEDGPTPAPTGCAAPPALPGSYLVVELTNRCSLACVHCSVSEVGHGHHDNTGYLDPLLFDDLIDDSSTRGTVRRADPVLAWRAPAPPALHPHLPAGGARGRPARHVRPGRVPRRNASRRRSCASSAQRNPVPQVLHLCSMPRAARSTTRSRGLTGSTASKSM